MRSPTISSCRVESASNLLFKIWHCFFSLIHKAILWRFKTCVHCETTKSGEIYLFSASLWWKHSASFLLGFWNMRIIPEDTPVYSVGHTRLLLPSDHTRGCVSQPSPSLLPPVCSQPLCGTHCTSLLLSWSIGSAHTSWPALSDWPFLGSWVPSQLSS